MIISNEEAARQIAVVASDMIQDERKRQREVKGYTFEHDDNHDDETLAIAAAFYILPASLNPDICYINGTFDGSAKLNVNPLQELIGEYTFKVFRDDQLDFAEADDSLDKRINVLIKGLALGQAELERLLRIREARYNARGPT